MNIQYIIIILLFCNLRLLIFHVRGNVYVYHRSFLYIHFVEYISRHVVVALVWWGEGREPITTGVRDDVTA